MPVTIRRGGPIAESHRLPLPEIHKGRQSGGVKCRLIARTGLEVEMLAARQQPHHHPVQIKSVPAEHRPRPHRAKGNGGFREAGEEGCILRGHRHRAARALLFDRRMLPQAMPLVAVTDLAAVIPARRRLLGLDIGTKTIGLALSDGLGLSATPLETLKRGKFTADAEYLLKLIKDRQVGGLVAGLPRNMDGSEGASAQRIRDTMSELDRKLALPYTLWDERLSTVAVTRTLLEADVSRAKRAESVDKLAAAYILQGALDRLRAAAV